MAFTLQHIVPWGRNLYEYSAFFKLSDTDLTKSILSVADGPASFNAEMHHLGHACVSVDPIYNFSVEQIAQRIDETKDEVGKQLVENQGNFIWKHVKTPKELIELRLIAMEKFLDHYKLHHQNDRYKAGELPNLPFETDSFDLILCSHFLFLYSQHLDFYFHLRSIQEMLRVGKEIRIFPLVDIDARPSPYVEGILDFFRKKDVFCEIKTVDYEFQKGGNKMLIVMQKMNRK